MSELSPVVFYLVLAIALIGTELLVMQFSFFWFLFFGVGALITSVVSWAIPEISWFQATACFLIFSLLTALALYPMLRKWQKQPAPIAGNDAIGQRVQVIQAISDDSEGKVQWSGSDWPARLAEGEVDFSVGDTAIIKRLEGIRLFVGRR